MKISVSTLRDMARVYTIGEIASLTKSRYNTTWYRMQLFDIKPRSARHETRWSPKETAILLQGVANRLSFADIARKLPGRTRDMCLGKWYRIRKVDRKSAQA